MNALLITYDLNKGGLVGNDKGQNYAGLYERIKQASNGSHWHCVESVWIIKSNYTAEQARDYLGTAIDENDLLFVVDITNKFWAWKGFKGECATWIKSNL